MKLPRAGPGSCSIGPIHFLAGWRKWRLNQVFSIISWYACLFVCEGVCVCEYFVCHYFVCVCVCVCVRACVCACVHCYLGSLCC